MSRYTYAGEFKNPTENYYVKAVAVTEADEFDNLSETGDFVYEVWVRYDRESDGSARPDNKIEKAGQFEEADEAEEWIEGVREFFEDDYSDYLEENRYEIARMEQYENFRNEY